MNLESRTVEIGASALNDIFEPDTFAGEAKSGTHQQRIEQVEYIAGVIKQQPQMEVSRVLVRE